MKIDLHFASSETYSVMACISLFEECVLLLQRRSVMKESLGRRLASMDYCAAPCPGKLLAFGRFAKSYSGNQDTPDVMRRQLSLMGLASRFVRLDME